ncbi:hypothetical protein BV20DRAFT_974200 [Pilatotrama ljubarskyi]|nr:hypothetical protein BV20DRAFT_974200 [Pilatotrama ljubarskyi]
MEDPSPSTSARPTRRSGRTPANPPPKTSTVAQAQATTTIAETESPAQGKRKARPAADKTSAEKLEYLLTNPKSKITKIDISEVINYTNFLELPPEAQNRLCALLPPTAFTTYTPNVCPTHPDYSPPDSDKRSAQDVAKDMDIDAPEDASSPRAAARTSATLDPTVFTSPFFLSAAHTFQDHLFSSWLGKKASEELTKFQDGARAGGLHVDWKDEVWERDHRPVVKAKKKQSLRADLTGLAKRGLLQKGDVLAYRRVFPTLNATVEKDVLLESTDPLVFLLSPGTQKALPPSLLVHEAKDSSEKILSIEDIADPVALERGVLDVDGRVRSSDKYAQDAASCAAPTSPSGGPSAELANLIAVRAWKGFTVWRWREEMRDEAQLQALQERGGRERVATLFYLRGCCSSQ